MRRDGPALHDESAHTDMPPGIGPHEGRELDLMLSGAKPLAMFSDVVPPSFEPPEAAFAPHVAAGRVVERQEYLVHAGTGTTLRFVYYAVPGEVWRIDALHAINREIYSGLRSCTELDERRTGELLGYDPDDIEAYLRHTRQGKEGVET